MINQALLDRLCINTLRTLLRTLSIDAIQKAHSGHPGTPMGAAPTVYCLWQRFLRYDPDNVNWANRDRFVLSNGHASAMRTTRISPIRLITCSAVSCPRAGTALYRHFRQMRRAWRLATRRAKC